MITFKEFEKIFKTAFMVAHYDAFANRELYKTVHWLLYFDGKDFDIRPVNSEITEFDKEHLFCFNANFMDSFKSIENEIISAIEKLLDYEEMRVLLLIKNEFMEKDKFVDDSLLLELLRKLPDSAMIKVKCLFNKIFENFYEDLKVRSEYITFIYAIKDMFKFEEK